MCAVSSGGPIGIAAVLQLSLTGVGIGREP